MDSVTPIDLSQVSNPAYVALSQPTVLEKIMSNLEARESATGASIAMLTRRSRAMFEPRVTKIHSIGPTRKPERCCIVLHINHPDFRGGYSLWCSNKILRVRLTAPRWEDRFYSVLRALASTRYYTRTVIKDGQRQQVLV